MDAYSVHGAVLVGAEAVPVSVEVSLSSGIPGITIVGKPDVSVLDARQRIRCAFRDTGFEVPRAHITVNLAPGEVKKVGTGLDLPMAVALLAATGQIPRQGLDGCLFAGELSLSGEVWPVRGSVAYALLAKQAGLSLVTAPHDEARLVGAHELIAYDLSSLRTGIASLPEAGETFGGSLPEPDDEPSLDYADVADQEIAKRAFVIAAAGRHGVLMMGPPGAGKTMLARRLPTIMPPLSSEERVECLLLHSVAGQDTSSIAQGVPPFRAPHHSISQAGLTGGGRPVIPGEVSLAHHGVLFLDELPEFHNNVLQALRGPLEDGHVSIVRVEGSYDFPSEFMLVGAANPCPCGHLGDPGHTCTCSESRVQSYQGKIGGPLMDRIDVFVDVARPASRAVVRGTRGLSSHDMAQQVESARAFRSWREGRGESEAKGVARLGLDERALGVLEGMAERKGFGGRGITRVARVARTIADLSEHEAVGVEEVIEACSYRPRSE